jgi:hypothetical protein
MVENILAAIDREAISGSADAEWAQKAAAVMRSKSPLSLKLALAQVRRGKAWDFGTCMQMEFRIVSRVIHGNDFYAGVRAVIVDKDNNPRWRPPCRMSTKPKSSLRAARSRTDLSHRPPFPKIFGRSSRFSSMRRPFALPLDATAIFFGNGGGLDDQGPHHWGAGMRIGFGEVVPLETARCVADGDCILRRH